MKDLGADQVTVKALLQSRWAVGKTSRIRAAGISMLPTVREGDCLTIRYVGPGDLALGDLGVFWAGKSLLVHRVIGIRLREGKYHFVLKGDSSLETQFLYEAHLLAKVIEIHGDSRIIRLEEGLWPWINRALGVLSRWSYQGWMLLKKAEAWVWGAQPRFSRFLPSRMSLLSGSLLQRGLISLLYIFQGRN